MTKHQWQPRQLIEHEYKRALRNLLGCMSNFVELMELDTPESIISSLQKYTDSDFFMGLARKASMKMITMLRIDGFRTWRQAAAKSSRGRYMYRALMEEMKGPVGARVNQLVADNAKLISTFPSSISGEITSFIKEETYKGLRASEVVKTLAGRFPEISRGRLNLIARTETSKASTALVQTRSESLGLNWYIWRTSEDARVRPAHNRMEGVLVRWTDPPAPEQLNGQKSEGHYNAGNIYNCRCYPQPMLDLSQIQWPSKVYMSGSVQRMTRSQFEEIGSMRNAA